MFNCTYTKFDVASGDETEDILVGGREV